MIPIEEIARFRQREGQAIPDLTAYAGREIVIWASLPYARDPDAARIPVSVEIRDQLRELAREEGVTYDRLIERMLRVYKPTPISGV